MKRTLSEHCPNCGQRVDHEFEDIKSGVYAILYVGDNVVIDGTVRALWGIRQREDGWRELVFANTELGPEAYEVVAVDAAADESEADTLKASAAAAAESERRVKTAALRAALREILEVENIGPLQAYMDLVAYAGSMRRVLRRPVAEGIPLETLYGYELPYKTVVDCALSEITALMGEADDD